MDSAYTNWAEMRRGALTYTRVARDWRKLFISAANVVNCDIS